MIDDKNSLWNESNIQRRELYVNKEKPQKKKQGDMEKRFRQILQITITFEVLYCKTKSKDAGRRSHHHL